MLCDMGMLLSLSESQIPYLYSRACDGLSRAGACLSFLYIYHYPKSVSFASHSNLAWLALDLAAYWPDVWPYLGTLDVFQPLGPIEVCSALNFFFHSAFKLSSMSISCLV